MQLTLQERLLQPFPSTRVHWRVGARTKDKSKGIALAYIDARDVMQRLDEVVGWDGWQSRYPLSDGKILICDIGIKLQNEWVWRANGAGDTQVEAEKGKASDAFKRAAVLWGIGRYLYSLPNTWVPLTQGGHGLAQTPALPAWATPEGYLELISRRRAEAKMEAETDDPLDELAERMKLRGIE